MRPEDIFDAITDIRDDQIEYAKPRRSRRWYAVPIAACLVLALTVLPIMRARSPGTRPLYTGCAQLASARYPDGDAVEGLGPFSGETFMKAPCTEGAEEPSDSPGSFWAESAGTFLTANNGENLIFSPISLYTILGMSAELCEGEPQREILDLLDSPDLKSLRQSANGVWLDSYSQGDSVCLLANSLWLSNAVDYKQPVLDILSESYFADSFRGDMGSPEYDRLHLKWLDGKTGGLLKDDLRPLDTPEDTLIYLDSAVYYNARWVDEFDPADNSEGDFHAVYMDQPCTFMNLSEDGEYYRGDGFTATAKYMYGGQRMLFVLPDEGVSTNELLARGEYKRFIETYLRDPGEWEDTGRARINLSVPKFDVSSHMDMAPGLRAMGVNGIFESGGSFTPLTDRDLAFTCVKNTCRFSIDEEGCEGASVMIAPASGEAPPPGEELDFVLDRPFLFAVVNSAGLPVYMGALNRVTE